MPIRNMGTLLENLVLLESMRLLVQEDQTAVLDFLNSFAMPPLSTWIAHNNDYGFSAEQLNALRIGPQPTVPESYQGLLWSCLQQPPAEPGTRGPNGALLCAMLAHYMGCPLRLWLNDIPRGHYGDALPDLAAMNTSVKEILELEEVPIHVTMVCNGPWPKSLAQTADTNLADTLNGWGDAANARLGYLDPMRYRIHGGAGGETDSASHRKWLGLLAAGDPCHVISVHFTAHRNWKTLRPEIESMRDDGAAAGYPHSLVACHSYYHVVCNVRSRLGPEAAHDLASNLQQAVEGAWASWFQTTGRRPNKLRTDVL